MVLLPRLMMAVPLVFDIVMIPVARLLKVAPRLLRMPKPTVVDIAMPPELLMVPPWLLMVPRVLIWPPDDISMVPPALFDRVRPLLMVSSPFTVIVFEELLSNRPLVPITSSELFSMVSVPVVSMNPISSVTITFPSMVMVSEPVGSMPLLQLNRSDQTPVAPPAQTRLAVLGGVTRPQTSLVIAFPVSNPVSVVVWLLSVQLTIEPRFVVLPALI